MFSRRDFLKKTGLALGSLVLSNSLNSKVVKGANYKDITDQIPEASQEEFLKADWFGNFYFDIDDEREKFQSYSKNDSTLLKFYPLNEDGVPCEFNIDTYDGGLAWDTEPLIDVKTVSARQIGDKGIKFKMNLAKGPVPQNLSEADEKVILDKENPLKYVWRIDTDRKKETGEEGMYIGADYHLILQGNTKEWEASLKNMIEDDELPVEDYSIIGNEIETTLNLDDIGNPESFDFAAWTRSPEKEEGPNRFEDRSPEFTDGGNDFLGAKKPEKEEFSPGTFEVDPDYSGDGSEKIRKIYRLPSHIEEFEVKDLSKKEPRVITATSKDSEFLIDYHEGDVRIRERV